MEKGVLRKAGAPPTYSTANFQLAMHYLPKSISQSNKMGWLFCGDFINLVNCVIGYLF
jgi:hypothetical protein